MPCSFFPFIFVSDSVSWLDPIYVPTLYPYVLLNTSAFFPSTVTLFDYVPVDVLLLPQSGTSCTCLEKCLSTGRIPISCPGSVIMGGLSSIQYLSFTPLFPYYLGRSYASPNFASLPLFIYGVLYSTYILHPRRADVQSSYLICRGIAWCGFLHGKGSSGWMLWLCPCRITPAPLFHPSLVFWHPRGGHCGEGMLMGSRVTSMKYYSVRISYVVPVF